MVDHLSMVKRIGPLAHTVDKCYKLHGYPPGFKGKNKVSTSSAHQVTGPFIQEPPDNLQNLSHLAN